MPITNMSTVDKQYGLIEPKSGKKLTVSDVFNNDSDSGGEQGSKWGKKPVQKEEKGLKKQTKIEMQRALQQDPTVYQYDEIYEEMTQKKQELEQSKVVPEKKAKYIHNLMKTAERRKKENERRLERQVQKEREAEGDMYKDKEEFITSSYKAKLEEFKKAEEEEKKMEYIESIMDVTKQQDLGGFYRHLYKETVADEKPDDKKPVESEEKTTETIKPNERNYRKRHNSNSNDGEEKPKKDSSSSSSDSDSSSDSSSTSSSSEEEPKSNDLKSGPEDGEIVEGNEKQKKEEGKPKPELRNGKPEVKVDAKEDKSRVLKKPDERDKRDRNYRPSGGYDRDRERNRNRRDERRFRERERERERLRQRDRREEHKRDRRSSNLQRRRSKTPERRRNKSRERSRSQRGQDKEKEGRDGKNNKEEQIKREMKEVKKEEAKDKNGAGGEEVKVCIWEKRTVGAVFEAALERYRQRKACRAL